MSSSDESKRPDNVITVDFRRRTVVTESGDRPIASGGGELVSLPFGSPKKAEGTDTAARAQARLLAAQTSVPPAAPPASEKPKRVRNAATVRTPDGDLAAGVPSPKTTRVKKAPVKDTEAPLEASTAVRKPTQASTRAKSVVAVPEGPWSPNAPTVSFLSMEKLDRFRMFIEHNLTAVTFDTRVSGVEVPRQFRGVPRLILNFSHNFRIEDFAYDEQGVRATLSFDTGDFFVQIPWDAIYVMMVPKTKEAAMWDVSVPAELTALIPALRRSLFPNGPV
jgi:hypothetical protein